TADASSSRRRASWRFSSWDYFTKDAGPAGARRGRRVVGLAVEGAVREPGEAGGFLGHDRDIGDPDLGGAEQRAQTAQQVRVERAAAGDHDLAQRPRGALEDPEPQR